MSTVKELKVILAEHGMSTSGRKAELLQRVASIKKRRLDEGGATLASLGDNLCGLVLEHLSPVDYVNALQASRIFRRVAEQEHRKKEEFLKATCGPEFITPSEGYVCSHETVDNGGNPFRVEFVNDVIRVYKQAFVFVEGSPSYMKERLILTLRDWVGAWIPHPGYESARKLKGAILIETSAHHYTLVAEMLARFSSTEPIKVFRAPIGNSDVPYPYAWTRSSVLFLIASELSSVPRGDYDVEGARGTDIWNDVLWAQGAKSTKLPDAVILNHGYTE